MRLPRKKFPLSLITPNKHSLQLHSIFSPSHPRGRTSCNKKTMTARSPFTFRHLTTPRTSSDRSLQTFPPERYSDLVRRRGGLISVPGKLSVMGICGSSSENKKMMTRLLLNVNIEKSLGPVQVIMSPESTVMDLIKAAVDIYVKEKRRPLLKESGPDCFQLHYSQFSLESLKRDEKLKNLGSRNFFLCSKPSKLVKSSCFEEANIMAINTLFPLTRLMDFLL